jgi:acyl-CoA reductase-like NAD-dependent aldehyde dehydrogenase
MAGIRILSPEEVRALSPEQRRAYLRAVAEKVVEKNREMTAILAAYDQKEPTTAG